MAPRRVNPTRQTEERATKKAVERKNSISATASREMGPNDVQNWQVTKSCMKPTETTDTDIDIY
jgi:hypothetical protein